MTGLLFIALRKDDLQLGQSFCFLRKWKPHKPAIRRLRKKIGGKTTKEKAIMLTLMLLLSMFLVNATIMSNAVSAVSTTANPDWPMFHHDPSNTGFSTSIAPHTNDVAWKYETGNSLVSSPAIADGKVFISSNDGKLYALDATTGNRLWSKDMHYSYKTYILSCPAVADGKVFVGDDDGNVYAFDATNGNQVWSRYLSSDGVWSSPTVVDGKVYIGDNSINGRVYALDAANGNIIWSQTLHFAIVSAPAVVDGKVYIGDNDLVYALNAADGRQIWSYSVANPQGAPAVADGKVYVATGGYVYHVFAIDATTGKRAWVSETFRPFTGLWDLTFYSPAVAYGNVYICGDQIYALNAATGNKVWNYATDSLICSSPAIADGKLFVGDSDGSFYALDAITGKQIWRYATSSSWRSSPAVSDGKVYVGATSELYCFGPAHDTDGDGLLDSWERDGIDYNNDGVTDLDLPAIGANWRHKDIFVEVDYMEHHEPNNDAINDVIKAFDKSPVSNPDGNNGITLHVLIDEQIAHQNSILIWRDFDIIKQGHFGTVAERANPNWPQIMGARRLVYRYCLFIHNQQGGTWSGVAELPGNDFVVSLGSFTVVGGHNVGSRDEQAGTFMHELGHTLGLHHGGGDDINCKPNYLSVMSYTRQFSDVIPGRPLDYSRVELPTLSEASLDETGGIGAGPTDRTRYSLPTGAPSPIIAGNVAIDWNGDGDTADVGVQVNINDFNFCPSARDNEILPGYNDWENLQYSFRGTAEFADGVHVNVADDEVTLEMAELMRELTPVTYTLTITTTAGGTTDPSLGTYKYGEGELASILAKPSPGYGFYHWDLDGNNKGSTNPIGVTMDADHTLHAVFLYVGGGPPPIKRPDEIVVAREQGDGPETVDPAWAYDTASGELISNVYDTLISFDGEHVESYLPNLATSWIIEQLPEGTMSPEGLTWCYRYTFKIKSGVKFHDYSTLTPADVEFSFEREMVQDREFGPQWMLYEPLLYGSGATYIDGVEYDLTLTADVIKVGRMIDHAVESNATHVWFNLAFPGAYIPLMQILTQGWASVLSQNWVKNVVIGDEGRPDWDGEWGDYSGWIQFHNPSISPLDDPSPIMMGSGPFMYESLDYTAQQWSVSRFADYHQGWPAPWPKLGSAKPAGYVDRLVVTWAFTWYERSTMFLAGDCDFCAVPREYKDVVDNQPGIRRIYPLPRLAVWSMLFTFDIDPQTLCGKINDYGLFTQDGIPRDFFGNEAWGIHVRKAFAFAIDYGSLIAQVCPGAFHPATAIVPGLPGYDPTIKGYTFDLTAATDEFKKVPGLWDTGFNITLVYSGNIIRKTICEMIKTAIESINSRFHVTIVSINWNLYRTAEFASQLPTFIEEWSMDFPDPHDFALPFYSSILTDFPNLFLTVCQGYHNPAMDDLISAAIRESDEAKRIQIYRDIQALAVSDCPSVPLCQPIDYQFERDWICGSYYNPAYPGVYAYNLWKWYYVPHALVGQTIPPMNNFLPCDVDYDGKISILDITIVAQAYGSSYGPPIHQRWQFRADIDNNRKVDIIDIAAVARHFCKTSETWTPSY